MQLGNRSMDEWIAQRTERHQHRPNRLRITPGFPLITVSLIISAVTGLGGCSDAPESVVCSDEFRVVTVAVVDGAGQAVTDALLERTVLRTHQVITPTTLIGFTGGVYPLVDDGNRSSFRQTGDSLGVTFSRPGGGLLTVNYRITVPGGCHVVKASGPDTVVMS